MLFLSRFHALLPTALLLFLAPGGQAQTLPTPIVTAGSGQILRSDNKPALPGADFSPYMEWLDAEITTLGVPGVAMGVVNSHQVLALKTWGVRSLGEDAAVDSHTLFRIASVSKTFAGAVAAMLVHDQRQSWDTPIISILPQYAIGTESATREMTLRHVLSHTTGLMPHAYSNMLDSGVAYEKIQEKFREIPTVCPPGRCYGYQNVVFSLVSDVVEVSEHESYEQYVQERLFTPLGMTTASVGLEGYTGADNVSTAHQLRGETWRNVPTNPAYYSVGPAAGVNASVEDMMVWAQANLGAFPLVLPPEVLAEQQTPVVETPRGSYFNRWPRLDKAWYGLGWRIFDYAGVRVIHHGGGVRGFRSELVLVPSLDIAMVVLFNGETPLANDVVPHFLDTVLP
ncbi:MAG: beta-lactamase family protein [Pseudomonadales bacterium]|nr:beta-lactamase family protein [Pseudomonadales bacterium]MCP5358812.1 beta-lactamase family protein [Pseudomonadales bacterium]